MCECVGKWGERGHVAWQGKGKGTINAYSLTCTHIHTHTHRREELGKEIEKWTGIVEKAADVQLAKVVDGSEEGEGSN